MAYRKPFDLSKNLSLSASLDFDVTSGSPLTQPAIARYIESQPAERISFLISNKMYRFPKYISKMSISKIYHFYNV